MPLAVINVPPVGPFAGNVSNQYVKKYQLDTFLYILIII